MTLRDLYKKSHWQVAGPTFYQLHLLFDKHYGEQIEIVDVIAERIQLLGGYRWPWPLTLLKPRALSVRLAAGKRFRSRFPAYWMHIRSLLATAGNSLARASEIGDDGTNDMVISDVLRANELQIWFLSEHLVDVPLVHAEEPRERKAG